MPENGAHFSGEGHLIEGEIEGDPNKTVRPIVCDADGHLIIDLDASTITIGTVDQGASGTDPWSIKIDQTGTNNDVDATVTNFPANQNVTVTNGTGAAAVNIQDGGNSITVDGTVAVSSVAGTVTVAATDLDIRDLTLAQDAVRVSANTTANSVTNPIFVQTTNAVITGEVNNYNTATVIAGGTSNHDYTVVTSMLLMGIEFACSGAGKAEVQVGPIAGLVSKWVGFVPTAGGVISVKFNPPIEVPTTGTGTVRVIRTNRNLLSTDVYSLILGIDA